MNTNTFILNDVFEKNAREYQTRPIRATKYIPGMESGFMVYFSNNPDQEKGIIRHEGIKFFDTEGEAWDFIKTNEKQYVRENDKLVEFEVEYDIPRAVLHRKESNIEKKIGLINCHEGDYAFISDESSKYDFFILSNDYGESEAWIIQDMDGNIRVWYSDLQDETFFGKEKDIVYAKAENGEYIKVAV